MFQLGKRVISTFNTAGHGHHKLLRLPSKMQLDLTTNWGLYSGLDTIEDCGVLVIYRQFETL